MTFAQPIWLLAGLLVCVGIGTVFHVLQKRRKMVLQSFASEQLLDRLTKNVSRTRRRYKNGLFLLAVFMLFAALARPQYGDQWVEVKRKGIDLLFALDCSKSMLAEDIKPNRLKRAHFGILDFVQKLEGDRVGLLPFAGSSFLMCPLTMDYDAFEQSLSAVNTDIIPRGGTNIAGVLEAATSILTNGANHKILIILTDGENLEGDALQAAEVGAEQGLTVYTVGVGTAEGELIPVAGGKGFVKDKSGQYVTSKLDETMLTKIAEVTGGLYVPLGSAGEGLETIYQQKLALIPKDELAERRHKVPIDRFEWPLGAALLLLTLELLMNERRGNGRKKLLQGGLNGLKKLRKVTMGKNTLAGLLLCFMLLAGRGAQASPGEDAFMEGDYLGASEYYSKQLEKSPDSAPLHYNYGSSSYKNNMYDDAIDSFTRALKTEDVELQKKAYFNLGNSHYQKGVESQQGDPEATKGEWQQAISSFDSVLKLAPEDGNAKHNREIIAKRLQELEKQMENQQQNQDQQQDGDGEKKQDKGDNSGSGSPEQGGDQKEQSPDSQDENDAKDDKQQGAESPEQQREDEKQPQQPQSQKESDDEEQNPQPINGGAEEQQADKQQAKQDAMRQQLGKMTKEEAERLLNALKNEEGELNFIPSGGRSDNDTEKDW